MSSQEPISDGAASGGKYQMTDLERLRHSTAHVLATAITTLWPEAQLAAGPPVESGFYYDIDMPHRVTPEDFPRIEEAMRKVVKANQTFQRVEVTRDQALADAKAGRLAAMGARDVESRYKLDIIERLPEDEAITYFQNGEFLDLCAGPHVGRTGNCKAFKLTHVASTYYLGDANNPQLQRIYGTAFKNKTELEAHFARLEEAKQRDHRKLGRELKLFHIDESVGQGLILWLPAGAVLRQELQDFIGGELDKQGYDQVFTPHIGNLDLFRTSGHYPYYADSQFPPLVDRDTILKLAEEGCSCSDLANRLETGEIEGFLLRPMNCPMHIKIFDSRPHSYRDLPVRLAEFGTVYRWEQSGEIGGMTRVRGFTQDDAHIFCTEEQLAGEVAGCLSLVRTVFETLGMTDYRVRVGLRDPDSSKYVGDADGWDKAEAACREAAQGFGAPVSEEPGEAAFYGPKIDFIVRDVIGREWQLGTVQVDYNLPERFDLSYNGADNQPHRPVMIHRAPFGSMERFIGMLIEHFAGNFPTWLAPEQVRLLPMNDDVTPFALDLAAKLKTEGIRCSVDEVVDKLGAKIRRAELDKVPHMAVIGSREKEAGQVSVRSRINKALEGTVSVEEFIAKMREDIASKALPAREA